MCLIHQDGFWFGHVPFGSLEKFQFLRQFPVDHLSFPVVSTFIHLLRLFATFGYVIDRFVPITA